MRSVRHKQLATRAACPNSHQGFPEYARRLSRGFLPDQLVRRMKGLVPRVAHTGREPPRVETTRCEAPVAFPAIRSAALHRAIFGIPFGHQNLSEVLVERTLPKVACRLHRAFELERSTGAPPHSPISRERRVQCLACVQLAPRRDQTAPAPTREGLA